VQLAPPEPLQLGHVSRRQRQMQAAVGRAVDVSELRTDQEGRCRAGGKRWVKMQCARVRE
jgi:hypothetical protein